MMRCNLLYLHWESSMSDLGLCLHTLIFFLVFLNSGFWSRIFSRSLQLEFSPECRSAALPPYLNTQTHNTSQKAREPFFLKSLSRVLKPSTPPIYPYPCFKLSLSSEQHFLSRRFFGPTRWIVQSMRKRFSPCSRILIARLLTAVLITEAG